MQKLLLFVLVLAAIYYLRRYFQRPSAEAHVRDKKGELAQTESMRECAVCGVLVPESEAEQRQGRFYCSEAHARQGESGGQA